MISRPLNLIDIAVILGIIILVAIVIYLLRPLIIAVIIIAAGYLIYRWYKSRIIR